MPEIRLEVPDSDVAVLDGYCSATGKHRTEIIRSLLSEWSKSKLHEATLILRVAGRNPSSSDTSRIGPAESEK